MWCDDNNNARTLFVVVVIIVPWWPVGVGPVRIQLWLPACPPATTTTTTTTIATGRFGWPFWVVTHFAPELDSKIQFPKQTMTRRCLEFSLFGLILNSVERSDVIVDFAPIGCTDLRWRESIGGRARLDQIESKSDWIMYHSSVDQIGSRRGSHAHQSDQVRFDSIECQLNELSIVRSANGLISQRLFCRV